MVDTCGDYIVNPYDDGNGKALETRLSYSQTSHVPSSRPSLGLWRNESSAYNVKDPNHDFAKDVEVEIYLEKFSVMVDTS